MLMSYRVDNGVWQLCGKKILLNILNHNSSIRTAVGIGLVVHSLNSDLSRAVYFSQGARFEPGAGFAT